MRWVVGLVLASFFVTVPCAAQESKEWERVYTFEDSFIDVHTEWVFNDGDGLFRVTFRWSFDEPQALAAEPGLRHGSRLEVYQFDCQRRLARLREVLALDASGQHVTLGEKNTDGEMRPATKGMRGRLLDHGCRLVARRLREEAETPAGAPVVSAGPY